MRGKYTENFVGNKPINFRPGLCLWGKDDSGRKVKVAEQ